jgi:hypothetical protein
MATARYNIYRISIKRMIISEAVLLKQGHLVSGKMKLLKKTKRHESVWAVEVHVHAFFVSALEVSGQLKPPATLSPLLIGEET